jgi:hypothetical protein
MHAMNSVTKKDKCPHHEAEDVIIELPEACEEEKIVGPHNRGRKMEIY